FPSAATPAGEVTPGRTCWPGYAGRARGNRQGARAAGAPQARRGAGRRRRRAARRGARSSAWGHCNAPPRRSIPGLGAAAAPGGGGVRAPSPVAIQLSSSLRCFWPRKTSQVPRP
ncbi:unnamed protein product, partial [Prorocentrum cordatum]